MISALIWNIRGISKKGAIRRLKRLKKIHSLQMLVVLEPKLDASRIKSFCLKLGFESYVSNLNSKIWCFFKEEIKWEIISDMNQCITFNFNLDDRAIQCSMVYASCNRNARRELWSYLNESSSNIPWMVGGDFNVVASTNEKAGGNEVNLGAMYEFVECIELNGLIDVGYQGSKFTWHNKRDVDHSIWCRLDRVMMNQACMDLKYKWMVSHLNKSMSDHAPVLLRGEFQTNVSARSFRFLHFWTSKEECGDILKSTWSQETCPNPITAISLKLKDIKKKLSIWSKSTFGDIFQKARNAEDELLNAEVSDEQNPTEENREELHRTTAWYNKMLKIESDFWSQKANENG